MGRTALGVVVVTVATAWLATEVHGGWGSWGASYGSYGSAGGSWGSNGSWGGSVGYASGGSWGGGQPRFSGRLQSRWAARRANRLARRATYYASGGSWGGSYGSYGSYGSSYASQGSWGSSGGSWGGSHGSTGYASTGYASSGYASTGYASSGWSGGSVGGSVGSWGYSTAIGCETCDAGTTTVVPSSDGTTIDEGGSGQAQSAEGDSASDVSRNRGVLTVSVPADARVFVNGSPTRTVGNERRYASRGLVPGHSYRYEVRAVVERDGRSQEQTRVAMLGAGTTTHLDFDFTRPSPVETRLTLHVPEDAQVRLSGHETQATGPVRRFATTRIESGQRWADYLVEVSVARNGRTLTKQQRVSLFGGDQKQIAFNFDETKLADARDSR